MSFNRKSVEGKGKIKIKTQKKCEKQCEMLDGVTELEQRLKSASTMMYKAPISIPAHIRANQSSGISMVVLIHKTDEDLFLIL